MSKGQKSSTCNSGVRMTRRIDPFAKFSAALRKSGKALKTSSVPHAVDILAHRVLRNAKRRAPVRTGALRASGRVEAGRSANQRIVAFGGGHTGVEYAKAVEYGRYSYAPAAPQPFLRPAIIEEMREARSEMKKVLQKSLDELGGSY